jgi:preprotein translocase subunit SecE
MLSYGDLIHTCIVVILFSHFTYGLHWPDVAVRVMHCRQPSLMLLHFDSIQTYIIVVISICHYVSLYMGCIDQLLRFESCLIISRHLCRHISIHFINTLPSSSSYVIISVCIWGALTNCCGSRHTLSSSLYILFCQLLYVFTRYCHEWSYWNFGGILSRLIYIDTWFICRK